MQLYDYIQNFKINCCFIFNSMLSPTASNSEVSQRKGHKLKKCKFETLDWKVQFEKTQKRIFAYQERQMHL